MSDVTDLRKRNISPANKLRAFISNYTFIDVGTVNKLYNKGKRIDVLLPYKDPDNKPIVFKGIEVLRLGTNTVTVEITPTVGDCVLLLCPKSYVVEQLYNAKVSSAQYDDYGVVNIKALLLQPSTVNAPTLSIKIDTDNKVNITSKAEVNVTVDNADANITATNVTINNHFKVTS